MRNVPGAARGAGHVARRGGVDGGRLLGGTALPALIAGSAAS
jgi:hypothetical protein